MTRLSVSEKARVARATLRDVHRRSLVRLLGSPFLGWRRGTNAAVEALTLVPQSLRLTDPSFALELASGSFGLAGFEATIGGFSPFDVTPPSPAWSRALHGFGWLIHLEADGTDASVAAAQRLVGEFIDRERRLPPEAVEPAVVGRRIVSWLTAGALLLEGIDQASFDRTAQSIQRQLVDLTIRWPSAPEGYPRLEALIGVVFGDLCIAGRESALAASEARLGTELDRQIDKDGGHLTRNAEVLVGLLLDLVPLRHCYRALQRPLPAPIEAAIARMMEMVRYLRLGDGSLARFNGVGAPPIAEIAAVLAYAGETPMTAEPHAGYARLESGDLVLVADIGQPPPLEMSGLAHAGSLAFELSIGTSAVFVNAGRPPATATASIPTARGTACHNTAVLADRSSARLVRHPNLERLMRAPPLVLGGAITAAIRLTETCPALEARHEGYLAELGLVHERRLRLTADATALEGEDRICGSKDGLRLPRDIPFAIHFHLSPRVSARIDSLDRVSLELPCGTTCTFTAEGGHTSLEPSTHFADPTGLVRSRQIVLRGACFGETSISWRLSRDRAPVTLG